MTKTRSCLPDYPRSNKRCRSPSPASSETESDVEDSASSPERSSSPEDEGNSSSREDEIDDKEIELFSERPNSKDWMVIATPTRPPFEGMMGWNLLSEEAQNLLLCDPTLAGPNLYKCVEAFHLACRKEGIYAWKVRPLKFIPAPLPNTLGTTSGLHPQTVY